MGSREFCAIAKYYSGHFLSNNVSRSFWQKNNLYNNEETNLAGPRFPNSSLTKSAVS